jgi:hypothetical protein
MAFLTPFDPAVPTDASLVASGDDELRSIKAGVIERMNTLVENFEDGTDVDGDTVVKLREEIFPENITFRAGTLAARPNPPEEADLLYYAKDTGEFFASLEKEVDEFEWSENLLKADQSLPIIVVSAGEARFSPEDDESSATKVKNAIISAKLSSSPVKVVFVPQSMWGYVGDDDYDSGMYDPAILLVREGSLAGWYDPIAYGADPTGDTNSAVPIDTCFLHASLSTTGGAVATVGMQVVAFTTPGTYTIATDIDQRGVALIKLPGVEISGAGELTGDYAWLFPDITALESVLLADLPETPDRAGVAYFVHDRGELHVWNTGVEPDAYTVFQSRDFKQYEYVLGSGTADEIVGFKELMLRIRGTATGTELEVNWATMDLQDDYPLADLLSVVATQIERIGTTGTDTGSFGMSIDAGASTITFTELASGTNTEFSLYMTFSV